MFRSLIHFIVLGTVWLADPSAQRFSMMREEMVQTQMVARDVRDSEVLRAVKKVPRHLFVPKDERPQAYQDRPLPIGSGQTISQPYIVAKMTELAEVKKGQKVLEIGTGSGYQAAILAELGTTVYSIEIIESLAEQAKQNLESAGYPGLHLRTGDGYQGWPDAKPFDAIIVTAAPEKVPQPLVDQLKIGGRLVIPVGPPSGHYSHQELMVITKTKIGAERRTVFPVAFVPMTGKVREEEK